MYFSLLSSHEKALTENLNFFLYQSAAFVESLSQSLNPSTMQTHLKNLDFIATTAIKQSQIVTSISNHNGHYYCSYKSFKTKLMTYIHTPEKKIAKRK